MPRQTRRPTALAAQWDARYAESSQLWSGRVNETLVEFARPLRPGRTVDIGCGEGADTLWLAEHGWRATGIDVSSVAIRRARVEAAARGLSANFHVAEAARFAALHPACYDLVTACFIHFKEDETLRYGVLRAAAKLVAPSGYLLIISHASFPPWAQAHQHADGSHAPNFGTSPEDEIAALALPATWRTEIATTRDRAATNPDGHPATLTDSVVLLQRQGGTGAD